MAIATIALGAAGALSSLFGGIFGARKARQAAETQEAALKRAKAEEQAWYDREYNQDPTKRASAMLAIERAKQAMASNNRASAGRAAVMGATEESAAADKEANAKAMANVAADILSASDARKDAMSDRHQEQQRGYDAAIAEGQANRQLATAQSVAAAAQGIGQTAASLAGALEDDFKNKEPKV